jgi:hypothetical protein
MWAWMPAYFVLIAEYIIVSQPAYASQSVVY